jgi:hypothetical protein
MIPIQTAYPIVALNPTSLTAAATGTSGVIDRQGYDYATLYWLSTTANVVSNCPTVLELQTADVTASSSFTNMTNFTGGTAVGTSVGFVIPNMPTATNTQPYAVFDVDLRNAGRYLRGLVSPATTQTWTLLCLLTRAKQAPVGDVTPGNLNVSGIVVTG